MNQLMGRRTALLLAPLLLAAAPAADPVVALRGHDQITASEARAIVAGLDAETRAKLGHDPGAFAKVLRDALLRRAILAEAAASHWEQRPDIAALLARARAQVLVQSFLAAQAALPAGYPSDAEIAAAYEANKPRFLLPRQYHIEQIAIPANGQGDARAQLAALRGAILAGTRRFEAVEARAGAAYADLGWVGETQLAPAIRQTVAGLPEGQVSDPVCTASGCHLLKLVATRPAGPAPLASVRDTLIQALRQQKEQAGERAYADQLLRRAPVQVNEIELSKLAPSP